MLARTEPKEPSVSSGSEDRLGVLLDDPESADLQGVGDALASTLGLTRPDATRRARYARGVLVRSEEREVAQRLLAALDQKGVAAFALPASSLAAAPGETRLKEVTMEEEALLALPAGPEPVIRIPWAEIGAISIYAVEEPIEAIERKDSFLYAISERIYRPGLFRVLDEIQARRGRGTDFLIRCDLLCASEEVILWMERDCRIAGAPCDDPGIHSLERFLRFLEEAIARSGAFVPQAGLSFLQGLGVKDLLLRGKEERANLNLWLWHMILTGRLEGRG